MPSVSKKQQKFMGIVRSIQKGEQPAGKFSKSAQDAAKKMKKSSVKKYAKTKHDDLPVKKESLSKSQIKKMRDEFDKTGELPPHLKKIANAKKEFEKKFKVKDIEIPGLEWMSKLGEAAERDYKAEYKKFQSSTKAKKYRAELNKYNRQKGTYGNGDGKDASHKGGKIVGFESQSKNRGRAEKSRLKKEDVQQEIDEYLDNILEDLCLCEACQKGYMTHPTRKTKIMFGKRYRNCIKKEDVNEYTYGVGDIVKDINPTCPHHGAIGKVKSVNPKSVVFVVMNKGKTYKPGDVLDKTHDQMKKMKLGENLQDRMKDVMKSLAKSLKLKSVVSMHTGSGSFSYFMDDKSEVNKLASMLKKKLKRVRIINLDKSKGDTANFVVAADLFNI